MARLSYNQAGRSGLRRAAQIIVLQNGPITERGTFEQLLERHGAFAAS